VVTWGGEVQARTKVNISSNIFGAIVALPVKEGGIVRKGDVLVRIDPERYNAEAHSLEASLRMARVGVEQEENRHRTLESQLRRAEGLRGQGILPDESYEQTRLAYDSSTIQLKSLKEQISQAEAALAKAKDELAKTVIYSPIDGKVTQLNTEVGEQVNVGTTNVPGSTIMVISDMGEVLAEVDVDESQVVKVRVGQPAKVTVDAVEKYDYRGRVSEIRNSARKKQDVNVFGVKVQLENPDNRLRPGMSARARIEIERREKVLKVPIQAVLEKPEKALAEEIAKASGKKPAVIQPAAAALAKAEPEKKGSTAGKSSAGPASSNPSAGANGAAVAAPRGEADGSPKTAAPAAGQQKNGKKDEEAAAEVVYALRSGKAEAVRVKTGLVDESNVEILSGLKEGDVVVTGPYRSLRKLKHGDKVIEKKEEEFKVEPSETKSKKES